LTFARGLDGHRAALRLDPLLKEVVKITMETFPRTISIRRDIETGLWPIEGDPTQLHQVMINLAVNARDAMPRGGTLTFAAANLVIDEQYARTSAEATPGQHVVISVSDTGVGIPTDILPRIFEPFFTTKAVGEGTGLGLSTVHAIVKSHGGFITVQSEPGKGTTFRICLPADPALRSASEHPFVAKIPRGHGELILVVDDEAAVRMVTQQTLEAFGYRVLTAADGAEAVALFASHPEEISLVVTDMVMPVMDGPTTIAALLRMRPDLRIIAASGFNSTRSSDSSEASGIKHYLPKPYNTDTLLSLIRRVLDGV
jgi:CheY-like chemotaxis protein